ncbi:MAG: phospho-N-acetylmuramoyl-pentapeptide-transferase [Acidimicrobiales bacterium]
MLAVLVAAAVALVASISLTPLLIGFMRRREMGQQIREDGPAGHQSKAGTPTMGGIAIVAAVILGYAAGHLPGTGARGTAAAFLVVLLVAGAGLVGFLDDWIATRRMRNLGLNKRAKTLALVAIAIAFSVGAVVWAKFNTDLSVGGLGILDLPPAVFVVWAVLIILATSNAVNLADGLDGLAAGTALYTFGAYIFIGFWQFRNNDCYGLGPALDVSVVAGALAGACAGFLWWNAAPARIFMGDTGALALGAGLGGLALATNTHLLLPLVGGLFVVISLSVVIQVAAFKMFRKRPFRMAPLHHHFELKGWPETTIIIRFWILGGAMSAAGVAVFYGISLGLCGSSVGT